MTNKDSFKPWLNGLLLPCIAMAWGIASLVSGEIIIPIRRFESLPIYDDLPVDGWAAISISVAIILAGLAIHFFYFWGQYPRCERFASVASTCTGWAAGAFLAIAAVAFTMDQFMTLVWG